MEEENGELDQKVLVIPNTAVSVQSIQIQDSASGKCFKFSNVQLSITITFLDKLISVCRVNFYMISLHNTNQNMLYFNG